MMENYDVLIGIWCCVEISVVKIQKIIPSSAQLVRFPLLVASSVICVQKEVIVQLMDCLHMCCVLMAHILTWKDRVIANFVMLAFDVRALEWKHHKCVQMEHTVTQRVHKNVLFALKGLGEGLTEIKEVNNKICKIATL